MKKKMIWLILALLLFCSCTGRNRNSSITEKRVNTCEVGVTEVAMTPQIVDLVPQNFDKNLGLETSSEENTDLVDEDTQFIVVTNNSLDLNSIRNYLYLCDITGSCSRVFETGETISSVSDLSSGARKYLIVSIFNGLGISLRLLNLDDLNESYDIETSGYSYFQDSRASTILLTNQQADETHPTRVFTFNLEDRKNEEIFIPCEVHSVRFGDVQDQIYFNGVCNSLRALYLFDRKTNETSKILDLPVDQFSISPDQSKIVYNYFTNVAQLELLLLGESRKVTNDKFNLASSFFTMWVDSDRLLFGQKVKVNKGEFFIWNFASNTMSEEAVPSETIALSRDLDFALTTSDSNELSIVNMQTHEFTAINLPSDQSANMAYFLGIEK